MEPIRLQVVVEQGKGATVGIDGLVKAIDSSMMLAAQKASAGFDAMGARFEQSFRRAGSAIQSELSKIDSQISSIASKFSRLPGGGGGVGGTPVAGGTPQSGGQWAASPNWSFLLQSQSNQIIAAINARNPGQAPNQTPGQPTPPSGPLLNAASGLFIAREIAGWGKTILSGVNDYFFQPFIKFGKTVLDVNDKFRKFEISLSGVTGGLGRSRMLDDEIIRLSRRSPLTIGELQNVGETAAFIPSLTSQIAQRDPRAAAASIDQFSRIAGKLKFLAPEQGDMGVAIALREAYAGQYQSLSRRFNVRKEDLAASIGLNFEQLNAEPSKILPALEKYLEAIVPDSAFEKLADRIDMQGEKLKDSLRVAGRKIANSGFYDSVLDTLKRFRGELDRYIDSPQFDRLANRIGGMFDRVVGNVTKGGASLLRRLSGSDSDAQTFDQFGDQLGLVADRLGELSDAIVPLGAAIGEMLSATMKFVAWVANLGQDSPQKQAQDLASAIASRVSAQSGRGSMMFQAMGGTAAQINPQRIRSIIGGAAMQPNGSPTDPTALAKALRDAGEWQAAEEITGMFGQTKAPAAPPANLSSLRRRISDIGDPNYPAMARSINSVFGRFGENGDGTQSAYEKYQREMTDLFTQSGGIGKLMNDIRVDRDQQRDALSKIAADIAKSLGNTGIDVNKDLKYQITDSIENPDDAVRKSSKKAMEDFLASAPKESQKLVETYIEAQSKFVQFGVVAKTVLEGLYRAAPTSFEAYARGLAQNFESSAQGSRVLEPIINSTSKFARDVAKNLEMPAQKFNDLPLSDRINTLSQYLPARHAEVQQAGATGGFLSQMELQNLRTSDAVTRYYRPLDDRAIIQQQLREFRKPEVANKLLFARSDAKLKATAPGATDQDIENLHKADKAVRDYVKTLRLLEDRLDTVKQSARQFGAEVRSSLDNSLGEGINNLITGVGTLGDAFRNLVSDISRSFSQLASNSLLHSLIGNLGQPQSNGQLGGLGGLIGRMFGLGGTPTTGTTSSGTTPPVAAGDGGIFPGGWQGIGMYAGGGVVKGGRGQLGIIGERGPGFDEAIIPMVGGRVPLRFQDGGLVASLPGGRAIPAGVMAYADGGVVPGGFQPMANHYDLGAPVPVPVASGGRGPAPRMYEVVSARSEADARRKGYDPRRGDLLRFVAEDIRKGGVVGKSIRRRGG